MGLKWEATKYGTKKRPAARWRRCAWSNDQVARRASAKTIADLQYLLSEPYAGYEVFALTITLPGAWHGIRRASLWSQYEYITGRCTVSGYPGWHSMRGLNTKLKEWGAVGGWWFFECKYNSKKKWWNAHLHGLLIAPAGWNPSELPVSEVEVLNKEHIVVTSDDDVREWKRHVCGSTAGSLRTLGFGERYTLDRCTTPEEVVAYSNSLSYCTKQQLQGPENELTTFLRGAKPTLTRSWGAARIPFDDRITWLVQNDQHDIADMLLSRNAVRQLSE